MVVRGSGVTVTTTATVAAAATAATAATVLACYVWRYGKENPPPPPPPPTTTTTNNRGDIDDDETAAGKKVTTTHSDKTRSIIVGTNLDDDDARNKKNDRNHNDHDDDKQQQQHHHEDRLLPREIDVAAAAAAAEAAEKDRILSRRTITIVHASVTGTCAAFAAELYGKLHHEAKERWDSVVSVQLGKVSEWDWWDELLNDDDEYDDDDRDDGGDENSSRNNNNNRIRSGIMGGGKNQNVRDSKRKSSSTLGPIVVLIIPTHHGGTWPVKTSANLETALHELQTDWRIPKAPLRASGLQFAVFGMGSSAYDETTVVVEEEEYAKLDTNNNNNSSSSSNMGRPAKEAHQALRTLGAKPLVRVAVGDDAVGTHGQDTFASWTDRLMAKIQIQVNNLAKKKKNNNNGNNKKKNKSGNSNNSALAASASVAGVPPANDDVESCGCGKPKDREKGDGCCQTADENQAEGFNDEDDDDDDDDDEREPEVIDLEDMGEAMMNSSAGNNDDGDDDDSNNEGDRGREMVTPMQAKALKKEGYRLIGSHSAVKMCRWTKHQLRGRGGCYKHTFYGITSYQCMEATPSLACANKCVFCWRHHKNPVGKEWRWKMDDPYTIVDQAVKEHLKMIKEAKGIPGLRMDRWHEAHTVRHCALSLVGEPIMYPRIDELLGELHFRKISTFLVTNGQHPAAIERIRPITQLYVSVDAPTPESLVAIDRPLFQDAWERLKESLSLLREKGQRTVARLTVVKGWNSDEVEGYAQLIALGRVSLVEVKGVTYCGKSDASTLNMSNTPWHHEVVALTERLREELDLIRRRGADIPEYDFASEHKHSCSVLLARVDQFAVDDPITGARRWNTWIDYDKFQALAERNAEDPGFAFTVQDYAAPTPEWALFGSAEEGFDPTDTRHRKKRKHPKYTRFDSEGIPTHDHNGIELSTMERHELREIMDAKKRELVGEHAYDDDDADGNATTVTTELKGGEIQIHDPSLMFRGLTIVK